MLLTRTSPKTSILEEEYGYRLNIRDRDWLILGGTTMSMIIQSIEQSRRFIFLISRCRHYILMHQNIFMFIVTRNKHGLILIDLMYCCLSFRNFISSCWEMESFRIAIAEAVERNQKEFIIVVRMKIFLVMKFPEN